jgi:hypothetical protein
MIDLRKHEAFGPLEEPSRAAFNALSLSMHDPVPVANATERAQLVADLTAAGFAPTASRPLYVHRADAGPMLELERTIDGGTSWQTIMADGGKTLMAVGSGGGSLSGTATAPTSGSSLTLPPGVWRLDFRMFFAISIASGDVPVTITLHLSETGVGNTLSIPFPVESAGTTSRQISGVEVVSRNTESNFYLRGQTSKTSGAQTMGGNKLIATRQF